LLFSLFAIGLLRFSYPILDPLAFALNTFYTQNLSKYGISQKLSKYNGLFQEPWLHICFGLNSNRGFNKTNVFASKPSFPQRPILHKNCVIHKHNVLHKKPCSCWACARAVCGLQDSPFHGGRRNTPKAVKYCSIYVCGRLGVLGNQNFNNTKITPPSKYQCPKPGLKSCISLAPRTILGYICRYYMVLPCITYEKRYDLQHDPHTNSHEPFWAEPSCKSQSEWPVAMHGRSD